MTRGRFEPCASEEIKTYIEETVQLLNNLPFLVVEDITTEADTSALDFAILRARLLRVELRHVAELRDDILHVERAFQDTRYGVPSGRDRTDKNLRVEASGSRQRRELGANGSVVPNSVG